MSRVTRVVLPLTLFLVAGEVAIRAFSPHPRAQVVRGAGPRGMNIEVVDGEPIWSHSGSAPRYAADCEAPHHALILGSSILFGSGLSPEQALQTPLKRRLGDDWCVHNHAQPAFTARGKLAAGKAALAVHDIDVIVFEVWTNDPGGFTMLGEDAYNLTGFTLGEDGYPHLLPAPAALDRWLFHHSALWEFATLAVAPTWDDGGYEVRWEEVLNEVLPSLAALADAEGARLLLVTAPALDRSFASSVADPLRSYLWVRWWAGEHGIAVLDLAALLDPTPVAEIAADSCCHYNAAGHELLAEKLEAPIRAALSPGGS